MAYEVDLTNCDREPIHLLGRIQNFGYLVAVDNEWTICWASENIQRISQQPATELLGQSADILLPREAIHAIRNRLQFVRPRRGVEVVYGVEINTSDMLFDVSVHVTDGRIVMEFEPAEPLDGMANEVANVRAAIDQIADLASMAAIYKQTVRFIRMVLGFDRVMLYQFQHDDSGEVVAEAAKHGKEPFLNLRYPASDIPKQARTLYVENPIRLIADVADDGVPIIGYGADAEGGMLDLSGSRLRSVSPIHLEYLRNMGVGASMSISIIVSGQLWGLIACHHDMPHKPAMSQRNSALLFGQMVSLIIQMRENAEEKASDTHVADVTTKISRDVACGGAVVDVLLSSAGGFMELLKADGYAVVHETTVVASGVTPSEADILRICTLMNGFPGNQVFATEHLVSFMSAAGAFADLASGVLAVPISRSPRDYVLFFRREQVRHVKWAGNPEKPVTLGPHGARLTPRKSFEAWQETVLCRSRPWTARDIRIAMQLRVMLLEIVLSITDEAGREKKMAAERQELLIAELNHRVRNILGLVRGLISQSNSGGETTTEFVHKLDSRVQSLARAHDHITRQNWSAVSLRQLLATESESYLLDRKDRVILSGPNVLLRPQAYSSMALVMHEMLTNSAKYGAMSDKSGYVEVALSINQQGDLEIDWREIDGPPVIAPTRRGFGSTIVERTIPFELGGETEINYDPQGVKARFRLPRQYFTIDSAEFEVSAAHMSPVPAAFEAPASVLIVEDNLIIGLEAEETFQSLGCVEVVVVSTVRSALQAIDRAEKPFGFALLDINLGEQTSFDIARRLRELGVPFAFASGYGDSARLPEDLSGEANIGKPYDGDTIATLLAKLCQRS
jgi:light-regulated signal transduction histidine kinase (bacteriophytochrome)